MHAEDVIGTRSLFPYVSSQFSKKVKYFHSLLTVVLTVVARTKGKSNEIHLEIYKSANKKYFTFCVFADYGSNKANPN